MIPLRNTLPAAVLKLAKRVRINHLRINQGEDIVISARAEIEPSCLDSESRHYPWAPRMTINIDAYGICSSSLPKPFTGCLTCSRFSIDQTRAGTG